MATQFDPIAKDESLNTTEVTPRNIADVIAEGLKGIEDALPTYTEGDGIDISAQKVISVDTTFTEASTRANIASGDSFSTILGKIKKYFTDLKAVTFSGAAADVTYDSGSVKGALDGLTDDIHGIKASVNITTDDLYYYTTSGVYCVFLTTSASPLTAGDLYILEVFTLKYNNTTTGHVQRLNRVYPTAGAKIFQRVYYGVGGWSAWREL